MNGEEELTIDTKWNKIEEVVNKFLNSLGINKIKYNSEIEDILSLTKEQISHLSKKECAINAYLLAEYATIMQKESNTISSKMTWAEHNLSVMLGKISGNYGTQYTPYEERKARAIVDDACASKLNKMILECKVRLKQLEFLSSKILSMSKMMYSIGDAYE